MSTHTPGAESGRKGPVALSFRGNPRHHRRHLCRPEEYGGHLPWRGPDFVEDSLARRANLNPDGKRRVYSSRYALSGMVYCGHCGDIYRRVKWNNRGCKSTVWRCVSRVLKGQMDFDCPAKTVKEEILQGAVLTAVNDAYARKNIVTALLK